jgi:hypothetical protein
MMGTKIAILEISFNTQNRLFREVICSRYDVTLKIF